MKLDCHNPCAGSAMVELMAGLIAILALTAGIIQVATLTKTQSDSMVRARELAGEQAMLNNGQGVAAPDYIRDCHEGPDRRRLTRDDTHDAADVAAFQQTIVGPAAANAAAWNRYNQAQASPLPGLRNNNAPAAAFGLVRGEDSRTVPLLSAVQSLLYRADRITIQSKVWMTSTGGLY
jgi:hypothetical protein